MINLQGGYLRKLLRVNLTAGTIEVAELSEDLARGYIGGSGLGAALLFAESKADTPPLSPDNPLLFLTGPLTGTRVLASGRYAVVTRSPLTGIWAEADAGDNLDHSLSGQASMVLFLPGKPRNRFTYTLPTGELNSGLPREFGVKILMLPMS